MSTSNAIAVVSTVIAVAALGFIAYSHQQQDKDLGASCWSEATKKSINGMFHDMAEEEVFRLVKTYQVNAGKLKPGNDIDAETRGNIHRGLTVTANEFYVKAATERPRTLHCGAQVNASFSKEKQVFAADSQLIDFDINTGEGGVVFTTQKLPFVQMVTSLEAKMGTADDK